MAEDPTPPPSGDSSSAGREALMVWVQILGLLVVLALFCAVIFGLTRMLA